MSIVRSIMDHGSWMIMESRIVDFVRWILDVDCFKNFVRWASFIHAIEMQARGAVLE